MHKLINPEYLEILDIYSKDKPDFLLPFFEAKVIKRLANISQQCWDEYCKFFDYKFNLSRLDHSLWVALIIWNFTKDKKQTLAWFFHDVSHSVFSHVWDYLIWDTINQESSEKHTTWLLKNDKIIIKELAKLNIKINEVDDYESYPIADNPWPWLAADRLEYTLWSWIILKYKNTEEIKKIYNDIIVLKNEKWLPELWFKNEKIAEKFWILSIDNDEWCFSSNESMVAMSFLSEIIKELLNQKLIKNIELYILKDNEIIKIIENCNNSKIKNMWDFYINLWEYKTFKSKPKTNKYSINSSCKKRYIDPLIKTNNLNIRLSKLSQKFVERRNSHLNKKNEWISLNYEI